jgi:ubiquinone biosynthesis protein UbiJ
MLENRLETLRSVSEDSSKLRALIDSHSVDVGSELGSAAGAAAHEGAPRRMAKAPPCRHYEKLQHVDQMATLVKNYETVHTREELAEFDNQVSELAEAYAELIAATKEAATSLKK